MTALEPLYGAAMTAARPLLPVAGALSPRLARAAAGLRLAPAAMRAWAAEGRRAETPLLWLHGASAGELVGAAPIVAALRRRFQGQGGASGLQLVVTHTSPSAEEVARGLLPDLAAYLPLDAPREMAAALTALRPAAVVFAKLDVWPWLTRAAARRGIPLGLVNATVRPGSARVRAPARRLLTTAYARLRRVGAVSEEDAERLLGLGVRPGALRVTGDAAFDQALQRAAGARMGAAVRRLPATPGVPRLIAGSTWPSDEEALLAAAAVLAARRRPVEIVLVPHEPTRATVRRLAERCRRRLDAQPRLWSRLPPPGAAGTAEGGPGAGPPPPLIVDATGVLAELYTAADLAWVGGGLGGTGLHSVLEPAAAGVPVLFGPRHDRREAAELLGRGGALQLEPGEMADAVARLLEAPRERSRIGAAALAYVRERAGAGEAGAAIIAELLTADRPCGGAGGGDPSCTRGEAR